MEMATETASTWSTGPVACQVAGIPRKMANLSPTVGLEEASKRDSTTATGLRSMPTSHRTAALGSIAAASSTRATSLEANNKAPKTASYCWKLEKEVGTRGRDTCDACVRKTSAVERAKGES